MKWNGLLLLFVWVFLFGAVTGCGPKKITADEATQIANNRFMINFQNVATETRIKELANAESQIVVSEYDRKVQVALMDMQKDIDRKSELAKQALHDIATLKRYIYFATGKYLLTDKAKKILLAKVTILKKHPELTLHIIGRASHGHVNNVSLSEKRAVITRLFLIGQGLDKDKLIATHRGSADSAVRLDEDQRCGFMVTKEE